MNVDVHQDIYWEQTPEAAQVSYCEQRDRVSASISSTDQGVCGRARGGGGHGLLNSG